MFNGFGFQFEESKMSKDLLKVLLFGFDNKPESAYQILLDQPDQIYNDKIEALQNKIDNALAIRNKDLFMKLTKEYRMLVD